MSQKIYAPNVHLFAFHLKATNPPNLLWDISLPELKIISYLSSGLHLRVYLLPAGSILGRSW